MAEITESIFDYLQEAASPLNLDGSGDDEDDDDDLRNLSTSFYNHSHLDIAAINEEETQIVNATTTSSSDEKVLHHQQQILNDSTELFYSAASAVSACLPFDNTSPAWVWGKSAKHQPQRCGKEHMLCDEDIVQIVKKV